MPFASFAAIVERPHASSRAALIVHRSLPSTNDLGRRIVGEYLRDRRVVPAIDLVAWQQTGGRGRHDRAWSSPGGAGAWVSMVRHLEDPSRVQRLPISAGVGLILALRPWIGDGAHLKWPNDIVVGDRKLAGILVEGVTLGSRAAAILGFGVNYNADLEVFEAPRPTSVLALAGVAPSPPTLAQVVLSCLEGVDSMLGRPDDEVLDRYRDFLVHRPGDPLRCQVDDSTLDGRFVGVDDHGLLVLDTADGERTIAAAELVDASPTDRNE